MADRMQSWENRPVPNGCTTSFLAPRIGKTVKAPDYSAQKISLNPGH
jgi:hypothetical protein